MWTRCFIPDGPAYQGVFQYNPFVSGKIAMLQSHLWYLPRLADVSFGWDIAALPSYDGTPSVRWDGHAVGILNTTHHPKQAFQVSDAVATSLELLAVWGEIPFDESLRPAYLETLQRTHPHVDWQVAVDGLRYLSIPPHGELMPNHAKAYARFDELRDTIESQSSLDLDAEIARLEADLAALFAEAQQQRPTPTPGSQPEHGASLP
jgi:multiple sugar transport system substrate-binding protein